jgi:hypothetical protein
MRILPTALFVFLMLASHGAGVAELSPYVQQRAASVDKVIGILGPLAKMAREQRANYPDAARQKEIRRLLKPISTIDDLSTAALASWSLMSGLAEHQDYDSVFEYAEWDCIHRIAAIPGEEARAALEQLRVTLGDDGAPALEFKELMEKQRRLPPNHKVSAGRR